MEIILSVVGKTTIKYVKAGIDEYLSRLKHYIPYKIVEIADVKRTSGMTEEKQKIAEGEKILAGITPADLLILLDERGKEFRSLEFANWMEKQMLSGRKRLIFAVGGPYGFSQAVYDRADGKISLSKMTFNHEMVRLFFTEQLYRAMTILNQEPYHHE